MSQSASYSQTLKSASMVGGSQFVKILIGIAQTKVAAVCLGPTGVGLIGAYQSIVNLGRHISGLGINQSGVREVAVASGSKDHQSLSGTVTVLRRMCWLTGLAGLIGMAALALPISRLTFGDNTHTNALILLSMLVLLMSIAQGQMAVIQGLRRIGDLVRVQLYGSLAGAIVSISLYYTMGMAAVVPSLVAVSAFNLLAAWWFSRKIPLVPVSLSLKQTFSQARGLLGLGTAFMISGLSVTFTAYAVRALVTRDIGTDGLGMYQAAFVISANALTFILGAMGVDFYPRLTAVCDDHREMARLVNEQTEIGLLLATPAIIALIGLAPIIIRVLYSADFYPAVELLRWFALGSFLKVISFPLGYVQLALGKQYWFIFTQLLFSLIHIAFIIIGLHIWGLPGAAMAFFTMYIFYNVGMKILAGHLVGFSWDKEVKKLIFVQVSIVCLTFILAVYFTGIGGIISVSAIFVFFSIYSLRQLVSRLGNKHRVSVLIMRIPILKKIVSG